MRVVFLVLLIVLVMYVQGTQEIEFKSKVKRLMMDRSLMEKRSNLNMNKLKVEREEQTNCQNKVEDTQEMIEMGNNSQKSRRFLA